MTHQTDADYFRGFISMREASQLAPGRPSVLTLQRWATRGKRGLKLRVAESGGRLYTRPEWLRDFIETVGARPRLSTTREAQAATPASYSRQLETR